MIEQMKDAEVDDVVSKPGRAEEVEVQSEHDSDKIA